MYHPLDSDDESHGDCSLGPLLRDMPLSSLAGALGTFKGVLPVFEGLPRRVSVRACIAHQVIGLAFPLRERKEIEFESLVRLKNVSC